jgi:hypothetical protein
MKSPTRGTTAHHMIPAMMVILLILASGLASAGERIFKTVDENGNVVFTDIPPKEDEPGEQIIVENPNSYASEEAVGPQDEWIVESEDEEGSETRFTYQSLDIVAPQKDATIRENAGNVSIVAVPNPRLRSGDRLRLMMDGDLVQEGRQTRFDLENVDRGTHVAVTEIVDDAGNVLIRSDPTTFHLQRYRIPTPRPGG